MKYHPSSALALTRTPGTVPGGEFDWGGRLPKRNGGAQRSPQGGWESPEERIGSKGARLRGGRPEQGRKAGKVILGSRVEGAGLNG